MRKILGLDLGTTSIGWALVNERENENEQSSIIRLGVRVNPLSVDEINNYEKGKAITTNADRRLKRGMRRNLQRYKLRRNALVECLTEHGIIKKDTPLHEQGANTTYQTYRLRAKAVNEAISLEDFARILLMINKKRGYKSNRKMKDTEEGELVDGIEIAKKLYEENITPGQLLYKEWIKGKKKKYPFYRSDLQQELDNIWNFQSAFYPDILTDELKSAIQGCGKKQTAAIFYSQHNVYTAKCSGKQAYETALKWRVDALSQKLDLEIVAYVISSLNGAINDASKRLSMISDRSKELYFNHQTVGQYLYELIKSSPNASLKNVIFYRQDYLDEFEAIWEKQALWHPELTKELKKELRDIIIFYQRDLKSCKSLVSYCEFEHGEKEVVIDGKKKIIMTGCKVCPKSSPIFQDFKIWQKINDIQVSVIGSKRKKKKKEQQQLSLFDDTSMRTTQRCLNQEEKEILFRELSFKEKMTKNEILTLLFANPKELDLNFKEIDGNTTMAAFYKAYQEIINLTGNGYYDFSKMRADEILSYTTEIFSGLGYKTDFLTFNVLCEGKSLEQQPCYKLWHLLYSYAGDKSSTGNEALYQKIHDLCGFEKEYATILARITMHLDYGSLSTKAMRKILPFMMEGKGYDEACKSAGYRHSVRSQTKEELESKDYADHLEPLRRNSLHNPIVEKILNQMINVVNELTATYGKPDEIRLEMARELKKSQAERAAMDEAIRKNTLESNILREELERDFHLTNVTKNDILRYRLYKELKANGYKTLYTNTYISKEDLFSDKFDIEHIIPKARLFDDSFSNKTLEKRDANIEKGNSTAFDYVSAKYGDDGIVNYINKVDDLFAQKIISKTKHDHLLMKESEIPSDFIQRDLRDSQYIARKACEILEEMVPFVVTTTGSITSRLREDWGLVNLMKELNWSKYDALGLTETYVDKNNNVVRNIKNWTKRNDHRHHAMDALTIAFTKRSIVQYLNNLNARSDKGGSIYGIECKELHRSEKSHKLVFNSPMPEQTFRSEARKHLESLLVSIKAKNKVITKNVNVTKTKGGVVKKTQLTPRGALHKETIYGKIKSLSVVEKRVNGKFTEDVILRVCSPQYRNALLERLNDYGGDAKKAFTGKNSLEKNPIYLDVAHTKTVPENVRIFECKDVFTIRTAVDKNLKVKDVIDQKTRAILKQRLDEFGGKADKAFANLDENPIWFNKEKGIAIKQVKIKALVTGTPIRTKRDVNGQFMTDSDGLLVPNDYVDTGGNHHVAIFRDAKGNLQEHIVSFYEAATRAIMGYPIVDKDYMSEYGWQFLFSMKKNEYFVFPNATTGFVPQEVDLTDSKNMAKISPNLYRVQKISSKDYWFRHHLDTTVASEEPLKGVTWKRITSPQNLESIVKVRINHIGEIVDVGEY